MRSPQRSPAKAKKPAPRDERWVKRRAALSMSIERAGLQLFSKHGFEAVAAEDIAAAADISRRSFYRYFDSPEEILLALPRRSLARISRDFCSRPMRETLFEAFIGALRDTKQSDDELALQRLAFAVMHRSPEAWSRAMAKAQLETVETYQVMIGDRLHASGRDPAVAGIVAAALSAIFLQVCRDADREKAKGRFGPSVDQLEAGVNAFIDIVSTAKPTRPRRTVLAKTQK